MTAASVTWEVKSVNGKSIEVRLRLPPGMERLEPLARQAVQKRFSRGNIQAVLDRPRHARLAAQPVVNEAFLKDVAGWPNGSRSSSGRSRQCGRTPGPARRARGAGSRETEEQRAAGDAAIMSVLHQALAGLEAARKAEGTALRHGSRAISTRSRR
jgi:uncharacterized protein YicC (UPF0701 family)